MSFGRGLARTLPQFHTLTLVCLSVQQYHKDHSVTLIYTSSFARSAISPCSPTLSNPVPDSSRALCAELLLPNCIRFELLPSIAAPCLRPLPAALPDCTRFSCCCTPLQLLLPIASASAAALDCVRFSPHPLAAPAGFQPNVLEHSSQSSRFSK